MTVLLDTHVLLWWLADDPLLPALCREVIADGDVEVAVSAASVWEMSIKASLGKLAAPGDLAEELRLQGFTPAPVTVEDGLRAGALPRHHDDPFDRMLIAQAARRDWVVATVDRRFADYDVRLLRPPRALMT